MKLVIDKQALIDNIKILKSLFNEQEIIAVVKSNAYGLGIENIVPVMLENGINSFAICNLKEALEIRKYTQDAFILLLAPVTDLEEINIAVENKITVSLTSQENFEIIKNYNLDVHVKIDTGFGRYGLSAREFNNINFVNSNLNITGIYSHLTFCSYKIKLTRKQLLNPILFLKYFSNNYRYKRTLEQLEYFNKILDNSDLNTRTLHIANSNNALAIPELKLDAVRIGSAFLGRILIPNTYNLKTVYKTETKIVDIKNISSYYIGYNRIKKASKKVKKIAIIPVGECNGLDTVKSSCKKTFRDYLSRLLNYKYKSNVVPESVTINGKQADILAVFNSNSVIDITDIDCEINHTVTLDVKALYIKNIDEVEIKI